MTETTAARRLLDAYDYLQAVKADEPPSDKDTDTDFPLDPVAWGQWYHHQYIPAYTAWRGAIGDFRDATRYEGSDHPFNLLPVAREILSR